MQNGGKMNIFKLFMVLVIFVAAQNVNAGGDLVDPVPNGREDLSDVLYILRGVSSEEDIETFFDVIYDDDPTPFVLSEWPEGQKPRMIISGEPDFWALVAAVNRASWMEPGAEQIFHEGTPPAGWPVDVEVARLDSDASFRGGVASKWYLEKGTVQLVLYRKPPDICGLSAGIARALKITGPANGGYKLHRPCGYTVARLWQDPPAGRPEGTVASKWYDTDTTDGYMGMGQIVLYLGENGLIEPDFWAYRDAATRARHLTANNPWLAHEPREFEWDLADAIKVLKTLTGANQ